MIIYQIGIFAIFQIEKLTNFQNFTVWKIEKFLQFI